MVAWVNGTGGKESRAEGREGSWKGERGGGKVGVCSEQSVNFVSIYPDHSKKSCKQSVKAVACCPPVTVIQGHTVLI